MVAESGPSSKLKPEQVVKLVLESLKANGSQGDAGLRTLQRFST
jgi:hypothetical protein